MGHVDHPGRHQRLEHGGVAQASPGLLEVGHGGVGQLAHPVHPGTDQVAQPRQVLARVAPPLRQHVGAQPQRDRGVAGQVPGVEQPEGDADVAGRGAGHLVERAHRVVEPDVGVPQRVEHLLGHLAELHRRVVDDDHVEVGVRRQLASPVAAHGHQRDAGVLTPRDRVLEDPSAQGVGPLGPLLALGGGHGSLQSGVASGQCSGAGVRRQRCARATRARAHRLSRVRPPRSRGPRCGRGRRCRSG